MSAQQQRRPGRGAAPQQSEPARQDGDESTPPSLFDPVAETRRPQWTDALHGLDQTGRAADVPAQEAALDAAAQSWRRDAERTIEQLAATDREWTVEDVRRYVGPEMARTPNVWGAVIQSAARRGIIEKVGYRQAQRPEAAGRAIAVWRGAGEAAS